MVHSAIRCSLVVKQEHASVCLFASREYLFDCAENKESVSAEAYCHPHLACPIRDQQGNAVAILDFTLWWARVVMGLLVALHLL